MMRPITSTARGVVFVWLLLGFAPTGLAQSTAASMFNGKLAFEVPTGFTQVSEAGLRAEYPDPNAAPDAIFKNAEEAGLKVVRKKLPGFTLDDAIIVQLEPMLGRQLASSLAGGQLQSSSLVEIAGRKAIDLIVIGKNKRGKPVRLHILVTHMEGEMLNFTLEMPQHTPTGQQTGIFKSLLQSIRFV